MDLVGRAHDDVPAEDRFNDILALLRTHIPGANLDPFGACRLGGTQVMVDRDDLRDALREMATPMGSRILLLEGDSNTGKSHAQYLLTYLQQSLAQFKLVLVDLARDAQNLAEPLHAEHLGGRIAAQMRVTPPTAPTEKQRAKWVLEFCDHLQALSGGDELQQWWIMIDHFDKVLLPKATVDLVKELAFRITTTLPAFRLILIKYGHEFDKDVRNFLLTRTMKQVTQADLTAFFHRASQDYGRIPDADKVAQAVAKVLQQVDLTATSSMPTLGQEAAKITLDLVEGRL